MTKKIQDAEAHPQNWIRSKSWFLGGGDDRTVDPGRCDLPQYIILTPSAMRTGGHADEIYGSTPSKAG